MSKIPYNKPALSFRQQIAQLQSRGLNISEAEALPVLSHLSYYRLSAYMYPFLEDKTNHIFKSGVKFQSILEIYYFDHELRLLLLDAIEQIEISFRTNIIYVLSRKHHPFWLNDFNLFKNQERQEKYIEKIREELDRSDEKFLEHFSSKYSDAYPPAWITFEVVSFGLLSLIFRNLKFLGVQKEIAQRYGLNHVVFSSWVHVIIYIRNVCAHHCRLWNRELGIKPVIPKSIGGLWLSNQDNLNDRVYFIIAIIIYFLTAISSASCFKEKFVSLIKKYPMIDLSAMGFPKDWNNEQLFKQ